MTRLTEADRLSLSAVVHQNYYMPDVFAAVESILAAHADSGEAAGLSGRVPIESLEALSEVPQDAVLVDCVGLAWQVIELGADWSATKGHKDTRRRAFIQAGGHVTYEIEQLATVLPMRVIDDGHPEPSQATPGSSEKTAVLFTGEIPNGVRA